MLQYIDRIVVDMCQKIVRQLLSGSLRYGDQVLDTDCFFDLSTDTFGYHCNIQAFTCRVDGRGSTGRSTSHYYHIIVLNRFFNRVINNPFINSVLGFEFGKQFSKITTAHIDQFAIGENRRDSLYFHHLNFFLVDGAIHCLMGDAAVESCHDIECLHHIRTVGASKRNISRQLDRTVQGSDTCTDTFVRYIFTFSITIQDSQQQGCKFMAVGYCTKPDTSRHPVFYNCKLKPLSIGNVT
ncbi:unknown [Parabacteroides johnsonii CAG:246]|nr:unknown [Parabacteroides johnsonii CAG:246]